MAIHLHQGDLPDGITFEGSVAVDTEAMGLHNLRDRLCLVQLCDRDGNVHLIQFERGVYNAPNLTALLENQEVIKLFHFARFDICLLYHYLGAVTQPVYCTKVASKLARTYTDKHSYKTLCQELLGVDISKQQQCSDWGAETLTEAQQEYAAADVLHLHPLVDSLETMLKREGRHPLAYACFEFLPVRALLDAGGWLNEDIFAH